MAMRYYSALAGEMVLQATINSAATVITVDTTTGLPAQVPYVLAIDPGMGSAEELVEVTIVGGANLTVTRALDGTSAQAHQTGAKIRHVVSKSDLQWSREHEAATVAHGATGAVVGTTNAQTLTNKTMTGVANTFSLIPQSAIVDLEDDLSDLTGADAALDARLDALEADSTVLTTSWAAGTGWSISDQQHLRLGDIVQVYVTVTRTGADLIPLATGDITNETMATVPDGFRPRIPVACGNGASGQGASAYITSAGLLRLTALTGDLATSDTLSFGATYIRA